MDPLIATLLGGILLLLVAIGRFYVALLAYQRFDRSFDRYMAQGFWLTGMALILFVLVVLFYK